MAHQRKDLAIGAGFGLTVLILAEAVRHLLGEDRSLAEMMSGLWVIPFAAFVWSFGLSSRRSSAMDSPEPEDLERPSA